MRELIATGAMFLVITIGVTISAAGALAAALRVGDWLWSFILSQLGWRKEFMAFLWQRAAERRARRDAEKEAPNGSE